MNRYTIFTVLCIIAITTALPRRTRFKRSGKDWNEVGTKGIGKQLDGAQPAEERTPPMDYNFEWNVDTEEHSNYYGQKEAAENGRVEGTYYNFLPDGRLMRVDYYVEGDSGFVPTITYEDAYTPNWGTKFFRR